MFIFCVHYVYLIKVTIAQGFHLFPFRTEKLSLVTPMVLRNSGRVGSRRFLKKSCSSKLWDFLRLRKAIRCVIAHPVCRLKS